MVLSSFPAQPTTHWENEPEAKAKEALDTRRGWWLGRCPQYHPLEWDAINLGFTVRKRKEEQPLGVN